MDNVKIIFFFLISKFPAQKSNFNNLLSSVAQQQQQKPISPQPVKLQHPGEFQTKPALITPAMFQVQASKGDERVIPAPPVNVRPEPLTQSQLMQALNYLMETDPDFIRNVHEAYIKSFNKIVSQ